jgi:hypothetical protein
MTDPTTSTIGRRARSAPPECRADRHRYGPPQSIGGGILRRLCPSCGAVSIDLTEADEPAATSLFRPRAGESPTT